ncbi:MAG: glycosyltransferase, partial [Microgenomates group bacterium]
GSEVGGKAFVAELRKKAEGYPIEIKENPSFKELVQLYGQAKIFWNASGYGVDEEKNPEKVEHFGMTTVEAMAAGCIPVVIAKGGQREIIDEAENGFFWEGKNDLINITLKIVKEEKSMKRLSKNAMLKSRHFSKEKFIERIYSLIE